MERYQRHPNLTRAGDIALQGRENETALARTNIILYGDIKKEIDTWREFRIDCLRKTATQQEGGRANADVFTLDLPWSEFALPGCEFTRLPHIELVKLLSPEAGKVGELHVYVGKKNIGISNQTRGSYFSFRFLENVLVTAGSDSTARGYCDPMEGMDLMHKASAAVEFIEWIDGKLIEINAETPAKLSF